MPDIFPQPNFVTVPSTVQGIEVYAPAPEKEQPQVEVVDFKCPQCGATTAYSAREGGLTCTHCGYFEPPKKPVIGKGAAEFEFTVETVERSANGWGLERKEVECQNCGARITVPSDALTSTCPFCGSNKVIQRVAAQDNLRPRFLVPFKLDTSTCQNTAREWLGSSWMVPGALRQVAGVANFTGMYLPFWTFDATTRATWKAEVGHTETENYYDNGTWKTRTKTVWRWESGQVQLFIDDLLVEGTTRVSRLLLSKIKNYQLSDLRPYDAEYLAGFQAQAFDIPLEKSWEMGRQVMRERTREACLEQASTSQGRNFSMSLDFADESWRYIILPVYLAVYSYENKPYQVLINGQTGAISGQRPVDWTKVWLAVGAAMAPGLFLGLIGLLTILLGGIGVVIGGVALVLLIIGLVISIIILRQAQSMDDA